MRQLANAIGQCNRTARRVWETVGGGMGSELERGVGSLNFNFRWRDSWEDLLPAAELSDAGHAQLSQFLWGRQLPVAIYFFFLFCFVFFLFVVFILLAGSCAPPAVAARHPLRQLCAWANERLGQQTCRTSIKTTTTTTTNVNLCKTIQFLPPFVGHLPWQSH